MYILNPTKEQLNSWYKVDKIIGAYLQKDFPVIHIKSGEYYFVPTTEFIDSIYKLPITIKIKSFFYNFFGKNF